MGSEINGRRLIAGCPVLVQLVLGISLRKDPTFQVLGARRSLLFLATAFHA